MAVPERRPGNGHTPAVWSVCGASNVRFAALRAPLPLFASTGTEPMLFQCAIAGFPRFSVAIDSTRSSDSAGRLRWPHRERRIFLQCSDPYEAKPLILLWWYVLCSVFFLCKQAITLAGNEEVT
jgi:hypothetical protein